MYDDLDDEYLTWLYEQVGPGSVRERNPARTFHRLFRHLYSIEFVYLVGMDDNRAEDGRALRYEWDDTHNLFLPIDWLMRGCSFLEMLIALSRRLEFEGDGHADGWFWHLLDNIHLAQCNDRTGFDPDTVDDIVNTVIQRTYTRNGRGGLFPLRRSHKDLRNEELWYQMNAYLLDT